MDFISSHKLLSLVILLLILGGAWYVLSSSGGSSSSLLTTSATDSASDQELVNTLLTLRAVTLSGAILNDPAFRSLKDFSTQIVPEPVGRTDPFAPLSGVTEVATTTSPAAKNTQLFAPKSH